MAATEHPDRAIHSLAKEVGGLRLHCLSAGRGPTVLLLHGFTQTSRMWRPLMPTLTERFSVIAPDLPGIGESAIPETGLDAQTAAVRIRALTHALGIERVRIVGHDIGLMVAYAYAAQFPEETEKLALLDAFLPGLEGWEEIYNHPKSWHFRFNGPTPETLVLGRERLYFEYFWSTMAADKGHSLPEADRRAYAAAYGRPGRMHAAWGYFASFQQIALDFAAFARNKLRIPVLSIGGEKATGAILARQARMIAHEVSTVVLKDTGHWLMEESPRETIETLVRFL
jgi:pimeloyl-ACP methyl ester carboxylesterase